MMIEGKSPTKDIDSDELDSISPAKPFTIRGFELNQPSPQKLVRNLPRRISEPPSPTRQTVDYWEITELSGCTPSLQVALQTKEDGTALWWGGRFGSPLDVFEDCVDNLPQLIHEQKLDKALENLPNLELFASSHQQLSLKTEFENATFGHSSTCFCSQDGNTVTVFLQNDVQRERAFALFSFIANAYVFSRPKTNSNLPISLPAKIAEPLNRLANHIGRKPIVDYACCVLNNWTLKDARKPFCLENIEPIRTFTGDFAEKWFYMVHAVIEHQGGRALHNMIAGKESINDFLSFAQLPSTEAGLALLKIRQHVANYTMEAVKESPKQLAGRSFDFELEATRVTTSVVHNLQELYKSLEEILKTMKRLEDNCPPMNFYHDIRPWLSSWPDKGIIYQTYCDCSYEKKKRPDLMEPKKFSGASGAQSSLLPCIDAFLGIAYKTSSKARTELGAFIRQLEAFRQSMPPSHRKLIGDFENKKNVRDFINAIEQHSKNLEDKLLRVKYEYNKCIQVLCKFRQHHNDFATKYIKQMALSDNKTVNTRLSTQGTGGTDFATHLLHHLQDTKKSLYEIDAARSRFE